MSMRIALSTTLLFLLVGQAMADTDVVVDDFESYTSDAELLDAWTPFDGSDFLDDNGTILTTDPDEFYGGNIDGQAAEFCGGASGGSVCGAGLPQGGGTVNRWNEALNIAPSPTQNIELSFDFGDDALSNNKRLTVGLRNTSSVENIIELGLYNGDPELDLDPGFSYRAQLFFVGEESNPNWVNFADETLMDQALPEGLDSPGPVGAGVHRFKAIISTDQIEFSLDLYGDGVTNDPEDPMIGVGPEGVDAMDTVFVVTTDNGFDDLRFGIPSHLDSSGTTAAGAFAAFDNISLRLVDVEPPSGNADFNDDGRVDGQDFLIWQRGSGIMGGATLSDGDANGDMNVDGEDLNLWQSQYGSAPPNTIFAVPEPAAAILLLSAIVPYSLIRRKR